MANLPNLIAFNVRRFGPVPGIKGWRGILGRAKKAAWYALGLMWHLDIRPEHFTKAGAQRYGYAPRGGEPGNPDPYGYWRSYTGKKQKKYHHTKPLTLTGRSQRATRMATVTSTSKGARVAVSAGNLGQQNPDGPDMIAELMAIDRRDVTRLAEGWAREVEKELAKTTAADTVKI